MMMMLVLFFSPLLHARRCLEEDIQLNPNHSHIPQKSVSLDHFSLKQRVYTGCHLKDSTCHCFTVQVFGVLKGFKFTSCTYAFTRILRRFFQQIFFLHICKCLYSSDIEAFTFVKNACYYPVHNSSRSFQIFNWFAKASRFWT